MASARPTTSCGATDDAILKETIIRLGNMSTAQYDATLGPILRANGIYGFYRDFATLSEKELDQLVEKTTKLNSGDKMFLKSIFSFFNYESGQLGDKVTISAYTLSQFDDYRRSLDFDPGDDIVSWKRLARGDAPTRIGTKHQKELDDFKRSLKPNIKDYNDIKDKTLWFKDKEQFEMTLEYQGLSHMINPDYVPDNIGLHKAHEAFLYRALYEHMKLPAGKTIVRNYIKSKDVCSIWNDICLHYEKSRSAELSSGAMSSWLTSSRLKDLDHVSGQEKFLMEYAEKARLHNEMLPEGEGYTDSQLITFLNNAITGVLNLSNVLSNTRQTYKAAGITDDLSFGAYIALLTEQAQVHDTDNKKSFKSAQRTNLSVNVHEGIFIDNSYDDIEREVNLHDLEVHQSESDKRPWMPTDAWSRLDPRTQRSWIAFSKEDKANILENAKLVDGSQAGRPRNSTGRTVETNVHDHATSIKRIIPSRPS